MVPFCKAVEATETENKWYRAGGTAGSMCHSRCQSIHCFGLVNSFPWEVSKRFSQEFHVADVVLLLALCQLWSVEIRGHDSYEAGAGACSGHVSTCFNDTARVAAASSDDQSPLPWQVEAPGSFSASLRRLFTVAGSSETAQGLSVNVFSDVFCAFCKPCVLVK